jgi:hypothetical protein
MTLTEALARFDALPAVSTQEMHGEWRGSGVPTGHDMDGLLETYQWYGKSFLSDEVVHPLVFRTRAGEKYAIWKKGLEDRALGEIADSPGICSG